jgi:hypothetical protein
VLVFGEDFIECDARGDNHVRVILVVEVLQKSRSN